MVADHYKEWYISYRIWNTHIHTHFAALFRMKPSAASQNWGGWHHKAQRNAPQRPSFAATGKGWVMNHIEGEGGRLRNSCGVQKMWTRQIYCLWTGKKNRFKLIWPPGKRRMHEAMSWGRQEYLKLRYCTWCTRPSIYILVQCEVSLHVTSIFSSSFSIFGTTSFSIFSAFFSIFSVSVFFRCISFSL